MRKASVSDFHLPSTCSGRTLGVSAAILALVSSQSLFFLQFTFLKSFSCSLYWRINSKLSSLLQKKLFLLSTASTLSPEHDAIFVSSLNNDVIILAFPAILLQGFRNENSSQTNAYSHYSNYPYSGLIPNKGNLEIKFKIIRAKRFKKNLKSKIIWKVVSSAIPAIEITHIIAKSKRSRQGVKGEGHSKKHISFVNAIQNLALSLVTQ